MGESKETAFRDLATLVANDASIPDATKLKLLRTLGKTPAPLYTDLWIYRLVVVSLGVIVITTVIGGFYLSITTAQSIPEGLIALGSASVGALAGLLAPSPRGR